MVLYINIVFIALLIIPVSLKAEECLSPLINWSNYEETLNALTTAYYNDQYEAVDNALDCLVMSDDEREFNTGKTGAAAAYWFFRKEIPAPSVNNQIEARIRKWEEAIPNSPYHYFAKLRYSYSKAWRFRGKKYAKNTSKEKFSSFYYQLNLTEEAILSEKNRLKETAINYNLLLAVLLDAKDARSSPTDTFNVAVKKWPNYYDFYELFLTRLVPKWGGSWDKVDRIINKWSKELREVGGESIYARLYYSVHAHNKIPPQITLVDWAKLKPSLEKLIDEYPAKEHYEIAASYACHFLDYEYYRDVVKKNNVSTSKHWIIHSTRKECDNLFETMRNQKKQKSGDLES